MSLSILPTIDIHVSHMKIAYVIIFKYIYFTDVRYDVQYVVYLQYDVQYVVYIQHLCF